MKNGKPLPEIPGRPISHSQLQVERREKSEQDATGACSARTSSVASTMPTTPRGCRHASSFREPCRAARRGSGGTTSAGRGSTRGSTTTCGAPANGAACPRQPNANNATRNKQKPLAGSRQKKKEASCDHREKRRSTPEMEKWRTRDIDHPTAHAAFAERLHPKVNQGEL